LLKAIAVYRVFTEKQSARNEGIGPKKLPVKKDKERWTIKNKPTSLVLRRWAEKMHRKIAQIDT
jgi:hypothetical protein